MYMPKVYFKQIALRLYLDFFIDFFAHVFMKSSPYFKTL